MARSAIASLFILTIIGCGGSSSSSSGGGGGSVPIVSIVSLVISPANSTVALGGNLAFTATGTFSDGSTGPASVNWGTTDPAIGDIDATGMATGNNPGQVTITATSTANPAINDSTFLDVVNLPIYAHDDGLGLLEYAWAGGAPTALNATAAVGQTLPNWGEIVGIAPVSGGAWLLETTDWTDTNKLHYWNKFANQISLEIDFGTNAERYIDIVTDSNGNVYTVDITNSRVMKYDPVTQNFTQHSQGVMGSTVITLTIDDNDNIYVQDLLPGTGAPWVWKVQPNGNTSVVVNNPGAQFFVMGGGMGVASDGTIYLGTTGTGAVVYRGDDLNNDGDFLDAGEVTLVSAAFSNAFGTTWTGEALLINDQGAGEIRRLEDLNQDGDFLDAGENTAWSTPHVSNGWDFGMIQVGAP